MRLEKFEYSQFEQKPNEWKVEECTFEAVNLIVGKNATGKTRLLNVIKGLALNLADSGPLKFGEGNYHVLLSLGNKSYIYTLRYHQRIIEFEELKIDGDLYLTRNADGIGKLKAEKLDDDIEFQVDKNRIAVSAKRDSIQHPYLDDLFNWAKGVTRYDFGGGLGKDQLLLKLSGEAKSDSELRIDIRNTDQVVGIFMQAKEELQDDFLQAVLDDMKYLGYDVQSVGVTSLDGVTIEAPAGISISNKPIGLYLKETDLAINTTQHEMSDGMFSAFSVLTQLNYAISTHQTTCIVIDDIGQGLDYARSAALVKRLVEKANGSSIQLIMTTNDRFIMNVVPLEYWVVLVRTGGHIQNLNYRNSKELFDEFQETGLNNFDFLSSDYYKRRKE